MLRALFVSLLVAGCSTGPGAPPPSAPGPASAPAAAPEPAPDPAPAPAPAEEATPIAGPTLYEPGEGHAGMVEALGSAGACRDAEIEKPLRVIAWETRDDAVYAAECEGFAYQSNYEWWTRGPKGFVRATRADGSPVNMLGYPSFDLEKGQAEWLEKARGPGDCGDWYRYRREGSVFTLEEHRSRSCEADPGEVPPPSEWPLVPAN